MGTERDVSCFEQHVHDRPGDSEFTFLLASLLRDAWNPKFFSQK